MKRGVIVIVCMMALCGCVSLQHSREDSNTEAWLTAYKQRIATLQPGMSGQAVLDAVNLPEFPAMYRENEAGYALTGALSGTIEASSGSDASISLPGGTLKFKNRKLESVIVE